MDAVEIKASAALRGLFILVAVLLLALWCWSLVPPYENWGNKNEDGFSYVPLAWATVTVLPAGIYLLVGGIIGRGKHVWRGRVALFIGCGFLVIVLLFKVLQQLSEIVPGLG